MKQLTKAQFRAMRALMPDAVTDAEIHNRTLLSDKTKELICLVGLHFKKCAIPAELPAVVNTNNAQAYHTAFVAIDYRATMKTVSTRAKDGSYRHEYLCSLRLQGAKEDAYIARRKPDASDKESLKWVNLLMLRECYEWLQNNY